MHILLESWYWLGFLVFFRRDVIQIAIVSPINF